MTFGDWIGVGRLPGKRIVRRLGDKGLLHKQPAEYLDETGTVIAVRESGVVTTPTGKYRFRHKGLETDEDHVLVMPNPRRFRGRSPHDFAGSGPRTWPIKMPDGQRLRFWMIAERQFLLPYFALYAVAKIIDDDRCFITLRWTGNEKFPMDKCEARHLTS
jgi:hypothetical protein